MSRGLRIRSYLAGMLGVPSAALPGGFSLSLSRGETLEVRGCKRILVYEPAVIVLALSDGQLRICGQGLYCSAFGGGAVTVKGAVRQLQLTAGDEAVFMVGRLS